MLVLFMSLLFLFFFLICLSCFLNFFHPALTAVFLCTLFLSSSSYAADKVIDSEKNKLPTGMINPELAAISYAGTETLLYDVSWTGGIKIGEALFTVVKDKSCSECYEIHAKIGTTGGLFHKLYPVEDRQVTRVRGAQRYPYYCEMWQKQGRSYRAHKVITYDQDTFTLTKRKDGESLHVFELSGIIHNEFSAFFASRVMDMEMDHPFLVPTFGDDERKEVIVKVFDYDILENTLFGKVRTKKVSPLLNFSGLYDKTGDTIVWYTDDNCRVPVQAQSKLVIGSLTATLVAYENEKCPKYPSISLPER